MKVAVVMLKKKNNSEFLYSYLLLRTTPPIFCKHLLWHLPDGRSSCICCFTKVEIWSCRKSALFSEEQQSLPQPFALAEILKQPMRGKQRQNSYRFVNLRCRYFLFLFWDTLRKRSVPGTRANAFPHVSLSETQVGWPELPALSPKILLGKLKQIA